MFVELVSKNRNVENNFKTRFEVSSQIGSKNHVGFTGVVEMKEQEFHSIKKKVF